MLFNFGKISLLFLFSSLLYTTFTFTLLLSISSLSMAACTQTDDQPITDTESEAVVENADDINPALTGTQIPNSPLRTIEVGYVLQVMSEIPASISLIDSAV